MFLKSETKTDRKAAVKIKLRYKRSSAFCEKGKIARKEFQPLKREIFRFAIFEGKRIDVGANKLKLGRFEIRAFCDKMMSFCKIFSEHLLETPAKNGNETLIFKRFGLFRSRFDSSDCQSPSKCFVLSNFDIPAYYLAGFSKRLSTVTSPVSRVPPIPLPNFPVPSSYKNGNCLSIPTSLDILDNIHPRK